ncbi:hypothetical protein FQN54_003144 [Arachnomyces sp. PD_36]|nr:hypothetical protein FQN54_003144 [Arachnomyces sp. PD_36]
MGSSNSPPSASASTPASTRRFYPLPIETSTRSSKSPSSKPPHTTQDSTSKMSTTMGSLISTETRNADSVTRNQSESVSSTSPPPNRILPQPIESTSKNSRRFLPQPTETSTRSSKSKKSDEPPARRKFLPEPVETTKSSNRPSSTSVSSNSSTQTTRRVLPQPIETASMSSRGSQKDKNVKGNGGELSGDTMGNIENRPSRRHLPEPIESVKVSRKKGMPGPGSGSSSTSSPSRTISASGSSSDATSRRFEPQLIETAKRSFRRGEATAALAVNGHADNLQEYLGHLRYTRLPKSSATSPAIDREASQHTDPSESRFSYASILSRQENKEARRHSFRVPDLPSIPSNSTPQSGNSVVSSLSTSPSSPTEESARHLKIRNQCRESCDERFSGYLLSLAARSAEKQLIDQTLAAFPNEQVYQPVSHFAIDREDDDDAEPDGYDVEVVLRDLKGDIATFRRESTVDLQFELDHLRNHKENAENSSQQTEEPPVSRFSAAALAARRPEAAIEEMTGASKNIIGGWQKEVGLAQMREAASPPMLGADIVFPQSLSPKATRCDVDQVPVPQHGEANNEAPEKTEGPLWTPATDTDDTGEGGLWKGMCARTSGSEEPQHKIPRLGILTPAPETENQPFFQNFEAALPVNNTPSQQQHQLPNTPPESDPQLGNLDKTLDLENEIDREFNDSFVTQIYNYLSLGYPAMAHSFDFELSKISRIPVADLRRDDQLANAKGYIGAPEGPGAGNDDIARKCMRWSALRLYIREWARQQQPWLGREDATVDANWGARARRGSWAF